MTFQNLELEIHPNMGTVSKLARSFLHTKQKLCKLAAEPPLEDEVKIQFLQIVISQIYW